MYFQFDNENGDFIKTFDSPRSFFCKVEVSPGVFDTEKREMDIFKQGVAVLQKKGIYLGEIVKPELKKNEKYGAPVTDKRNVSVNNMTVTYPVIKLTGKEIAEKNKKEKEDKYQQDLNNAINNRISNYPSTGDQLDAILKQFNYDRMQGRKLIQPLDDILGEYLSVKDEFPIPEKPE